MIFLKVFLSQAQQVSWSQKSLNKSQTILNRVRNLDEAAILNMTAEIIDSEFYSSNYSNRVSQLNLNSMLRSSISQHSQATASSHAHLSCAILHCVLSNEGFMLQTFERTGNVIIDKMAKSGKDMKNSKPSKYQRGQKN